jgi:DNA-binding beta-propeller fold protein YncE
MSRNLGAFGLALIFFSVLALPAGAAVLGSVVTIGGTASDIALDESRGLLYVADFGANVIHVMSTADNTIQSSINVLPLPGAIALSPDAQYLLVAQYCNTSTPLSLPCTNAITSIDLANNTQQIFSLDSAPLAVAFLGTGEALVVTTTKFLQFDPVTGKTELVETIASAAKTLPVPLATFPGQILEAALATSADGTTIWGIASAGSSALIFRYTGPSNPISGAVYTSSPLLLPRVSSAADGSYATVGHLLVGAPGYIKGRYIDFI